MILNLKPKPTVSSFSLGVLCASFFLAPLSLLFTSGAQAEVFMADIPYTDELIQLEQKYDSILDTTESKRCLAYTDKDQTLCDVYEDIVVYLYKTDVTPTENVIDKNTVQISDNLYKIYGSDAFYQDEQTLSWKQTEYGIINKGDFQAVQDDQLKNIDTILSLNYPFHVYSVNAQSPIYPGIDGRNYRTCGGSTFSSCSTGNGTGADNNDISIGWQYTSTYSYMFQGRVTFDTSALSGSVASSTICLTAKSKYQGGSSDFNVNIYDLNPSSDTAHNNSDYENTGTTAMSTGKSSDALSDNARYCWLLNTTGEANVNVDGYSNFGVSSENQATDSAPVTEENNIQYFYESETAGTDKDPYILVATEAGPSCGDASCNGDETCETCSQDCGECANATTTPPADLTSLPSLPLVDDLTVITGRTDHYESTTTAPDWTEYHYYRIPFFLWYMLWTAIGFILTYLVIEVKRILKRKRNGND